MKKLYFLFAMGVFALMITPSKVQAQEGAVNIDLYYGAPNLWTAGLRAGADAFDGTGVSTSSIGPLGGRAEYMITDAIGLGAEFYYASSGISFIGNSDGGTTQYNYDLKLNRPRILGRFAYHFGNPDKVEGILGVGAGWNGTVLKATTNDPEFVEAQLALRNYVPLAFRTTIGFRAMLTDFFGVHADLGLGGPLITGGLSFRIQ